MPSPEYISYVKEIFSNAKITQTTAHRRYANQTICNKYNIPTHLFSTFGDFSGCSKIKLENKEKVIVLSPDNNQYREIIVRLLQKNFPSYSIITVQHMTYDEYLLLIKKSLITITFGEGFDGYFIESFYMGTIGIAVYNDDFFPDPCWKKMDNVFLSYDDMIKKLISFINEIIFSKGRYYEICDKNLFLIKNEYSKEKYLSNIKDFYNNKYHFYPE